jgi:ADP-ribose pyrophosphatase YjhB (NUDIX family)
VLHEGQVLLVRRAARPSPGKWSLPGGLVELGETTAEAVRREIAEECNCAIRLVGVCGVIDRIVCDADGHVRYHYVLVDYLAYPESAVITAGSDAPEACWVPLDPVDELDVTEGLSDKIRPALQLAREERE